jgi:hypothetical protein
MMHKFIVLVFLAFPTLACIGQSSCPIPSKQADVDISHIPLCLVAELIGGTLEEYNRNQTTWAKGLPKLAKAEFEFKTVGTTTSGVKINFLILSLGGSYKNESTNDVTFSYVVPAPPPKPKNEGLSTYLNLWSKKSKPKPRDFRKELVATLQQAAEQVQATQSVGAAKFKTLTISLSYAATWDFNLGATIPINLVTVGPSIDHSNAKTQVVKLTFDDQIPPPRMPIIP